MPQTNDIITPTNTSEIAAAVVRTGTGIHSITDISGSIVGVGTGTHSIAEITGVIARVRTPVGVTTDTESVAEDILMPSDYIKDYLTATATLKRGEEYAELILSQPLINFDDNDVDPATRLRMVEYQRHLKARASDYQTNVFSNNGYMEFFTEVHNFSVSMRIAIDMALKTIDTPSEDKNQLTILFDTLSMNAKNLILKANIVTQQFLFIKEDTSKFAGIFNEILTKFDSAEQQAIAEIQKEIKDAMTKTDKAMAEAITNSQAAGTALNGFFQSVITTIKPEHIVSSKVKKNLEKVKNEKKTAAATAKEEYDDFAEKLNAFKALQKEYADTQKLITRYTKEIDSKKPIIEKAEKENDKKTLEAAIKAKEKAEKNKKEAEKQASKLKPIIEKQEQDESFKDGDKKLNDKRKAREKADQDEIDATSEYAAAIDETDTEKVKKFNEKGSEQVAGSDTLSYIFGVSNSVSAMYDSYNEVEEASKSLLLKYQELFYFKRLLAIATNISFQMEFFYATMPEAVESIKKMVMTFSSISIQLLKTKDIIVDNPDVIKNQIKLAKNFWEFNSEEVEKIYFSLKSF